MTETLRHLRAEMDAALKVEEAIVRETPRLPLIFCYHQGRRSGLALALKLMDEIERRVYQNEMSGAMEQ